MLDWAGTVVDFGCMAPVRALVEVFAEEGFALTDAEARRDMGTGQDRAPARDLRSAGGGGALARGKGAPPAEADIERLYDKLVPAMQPRPPRPPA